MQVKGYLRPAKRRLVDLMARARTRRAVAAASRLHHVDTTIAPLDEMYAGDPAFYFSVGASALAAIRRGLDASGHGVPHAILDFACGHGRVMRFMRRQWPQASLTAADIDHDGVDFCAYQFGATPVYSKDPLDGLQVGGPFDLIWSGSLLTHFDASRWAEALAFFRSHLAEHGALIFSVHGERSARVLAGDEELTRELVLAPRYGLEAEAANQMADEYRSNGFGFRPWPNALFGLSVASQAWVGDQLRVAGLRMVNFDEGAWGHHHDVVTCVATGPH